MVDGKRVELSIPGGLDYDKVVNEISERVQLPPDAFFLFHKKTMLTRFTEIVSDTDAIEVTLIDTSSMPNRCWPHGDWSFPFDMGRFPSRSLKDHFPTNCKPDHAPVRPALRRIIPSIGFEYGNPFSRMPTMALPSRPERPVETQMMNRDRIGVTEEALERDEREAPDTEQELEDFRLGLTRDQQAFIARMVQMGFDQAVVTRVFYRMECRTRATSQFLTNLRHHMV